MVARRADRHAERPGQLGRRRRLAQLDQDPRPGTSDQLAERGGGRRGGRVPPGADAACRVDQAGRPRIVHLYGDLRPHEHRRDEHHPVSTDPHGRVGLHRCDLDGAVPPPHPRVQPVERRRPALPRQQAGAVHDVALADRPQLQPVRREQQVPRPPERVGDPVASRPARPGRSSAAGSSQGCRARARAISARAMSSGTDRTAARSSSIVCAMPRVGGGTTKAGPPYGCWRASSAANAGSSRRSRAYGARMRATRSGRARDRPRWPSTRRRLSSSKTGDRANLLCSRSAASTSKRIIRP